MSQNVPPHGVTVTSKYVTVLKLLKIVSWLLWVAGGMSSLSTQGCSLSETWFCVSSTWCFRVKLWRADGSPQVSRWLAFSTSVPPALDRLLRGAQPPHWLEGLNKTTRLVRVEEVTSLGSFLSGEREADVFEFQRRNWNFNSWTGDSWSRKPEGDGVLCCVA